MWKLDFLAHKSHLKISVKGRHWKCWLGKPSWSIRTTFQTFLDNKKALYVDVFSPLEHFQIVWMEAMSSLLYMCRAKCCCGGSFCWHWRSHSLVIFSSFFFYHKVSVIYLVWMNALHGLKALALLFQEVAGEVGEGGKHWNLKSNSWLLMICKHLVSDWMGLLCCLR